MLKPSDIEDIRGKESRYAVVVGVAKRAREIAEEAEAHGEILIEKPVSLAINDFKNGDYKLIVPKEEEEEAADEVCARADHEQDGYGRKTGDPAEYPEQQQRYNKGHPRYEAVPTLQADPARQAEQERDSQNKKRRIDDHAVFHHISARRAAYVGDHIPSGKLMRLDLREIRREPGYVFALFIEEISDAVESLEKESVCLRSDPCHKEHSDRKREQKDADHRKDDAVAAARRPLFAVCRAGIRLLRIRLLRRRIRSVYNRLCKLYRLLYILRLPRRLRYILPRLTVLRTVHTVDFGVQGAQFPFQLSDLRKQFKTFAISVRGGRRLCGVLLCRNNCRCGVLRRGGACLCGVLLCRNSCRGGVLRRGGGCLCGVLLCRNSCLRGVLRHGGGRRLRRSRRDRISIGVEVFFHFAEHAVHILFEQVAAIRAPDFFVIRLATAVFANLHRTVTLIIF